MSNFINLVKLSVGTESVDSLIAWQTSQTAGRAGKAPRHVTRMWPKRDSELLNGGSIYWVIKGLIQCRQRIISLDEVTGADGTRRCAIVLEPEIHRTQTAIKRPFQGWRYLKPEESPADLPQGRAQEEPLPPELSQALAEIGVI